MASPRVVVVRMAEDWEALYVEGQLIFEGHSIDLQDLEAHLPDFAVTDIEVTEGQWGAWGFRAPKTLEEL